MTTDTVVEVRALRKTYGDFVAVDAVDLEVRRGEIFGIIGPNGAGKTTTVECIASLRRPDGGSIRVLDLDPVAQPKRVREVVGVQLQTSALPARLRVREALQLFAAYYPNPLDVDGLLHDWQLTEKADTAVAGLSGGQRQRLFIALALIGDPKIVVLDELTTGLDPHVRRDTWELVKALRDRGVTVLLVTHFMDEVERLCDRVAVIARGRVVASGTPAELAAMTADEVGPNGTFEDTYLALTAAPAMTA